MRIIGGKHKGRILKSFKGDDIRPTGDRAKESLFNILNQKICGASFLDLFSGTGAVGIEALSRGAKQVTLVDESKESVNIAKSNLAMIKETANVVTASAEHFLLTTADKFDIIFLDPPYLYRNTNALLKTIFERDLLKNGGIIVYEHKNDYTNFSTEFFDIYDIRKYGIAVFEFLRRK